LALWSEKARGAKSLVFIAYFGASLFGVVSLKS